MALTITREATENIGSLDLRVFTIALDNSYPSGGYSLTPRMLGFGRILWAGTELVASSGGQALLVGYDRANKKLRVFLPQGGSASSTTINGQGVVPSGGTTVTSSAAQPPITVNPAPAREAAATTNLSAYSVRLVVLGR
jgi:hypothetical protein